MADYLLNIALKILEENDTALSSSILADLINKQFQANLSKLDILLSLDKRFSRDEQGAWRLSKTLPVRTEINELANLAITLRQQALDVLTNEWQQLVSRKSVIGDELGDIDTQLSNLGYQRKVSAAKIDSSQIIYCLSSRS